MPRPQKPVRDLLAEGTFDRSRHGDRLADAARAAYDRAGGGRAGREAALHVLDTLEDSEADLDELHRRAWVAVRILLADPRDERAGLAVEAYKRAVAGDEDWRRAVVPPPPNGYGSATHAEWVRELDEAYARLGVEALADSA